jgi:hypothetical protein
MGLIFLGKRQHCYYQRLSLQCAHLDSSIEQPKVMIDGIPSHVLMRPFVLGKGLDDDVQSEWRNAKCPDDDQRSLLLV